MSDLRPGDLVRYRDGHIWVVLGFQASARGWPDDVKIGRPCQGSPLGHTAMPGDLQFLSRPTFEIGELVTVGGFPGVVVEDAGGSFVTCSTQTSFPLRGGGRINPLAGSASYADRGHLVLENRL